MSFREYLTDFRMKKAYYLLQENKYTVSAVSNMVGYKKVDYFRNLYQKYYGKKPSACGWFFIMHMLIARCVHE